MNHLIHSGAHTLLQLKVFLRQIDDAQYAERLAVLSQSSIGMHVRHVIEFYQCLMKGIQEGQIDYDARQRSILQESSTEYAITCIDALLVDISSVQQNHNIILLTEQNLDEEKLGIESNLYRELSYVIEHSIHHFAIIKIACSAAFDNVIFDKDFGVAYSTIKYRESVHSNLPA